MWTRQEYDEMKHLYQDESLCPFCKENRESQMVLWEWKYWAIIYNKYPYLEIEKHLLVIPNRHIEFTSDIPDIEWQEMAEIETWTKKFFNGKPYFSFIRQTGKMKSIKHLHYHYLPGEVTVEWIEYMLLPQIKSLEWKQ